MVEQPHVAVVEGAELVAQLAAAGADQPVQGRRFRHGPRPLVARDGRLRGPCNGVPLPGTAAQAEPMTFITDSCDPSPSLRNGVTAYHDVCSATVDTVASGEDVPTTLSFALELAGDVESRTPSSYSVGWVAGDCAFSFFASDATLADLQGESVIFVHCGDAERECTDLPNGSSLNCEFTYDYEARHPVAWPVYDGPTVTWSVTFDGDLASYADLHVHEGQIVPGWAVVGSSALIHEGQVFVVGCGSQTGCFDLAGDWAFGDGTPYTIG